MYFGRAKRVVMNTSSGDPDYLTPSPDFHCHVSPLSASNDKSEVENIQLDQVGPTIIITLYMPAALAREQIRAISS